MRILLVDDQSKIRSALRLLLEQEEGMTDELASKGISVILRDRVNFYGIFMPLVVELISFYLFRFMQARWPESAQAIFLILAIGVGIAFTILAAVVFKSRGFVELLSLHVLYAAGFGWLMPVLFAK